MKAIISINGIIGTYEQEKGVELIDVISQVKQYSKITELEVRINSPGGVVQTGEEIYNYLKGLHVPITTINEKQCASIASLIFLAGNKRLMKPESELMIHNPWGAPEGDADLLSEYSKELRQIENRIAKFYDSITQLGEDAIKSMMRNETVINAEESVKLGFATGIKEVTKIAAYIKFSNMSKKKSLKEQLQGVLSKLGTDPVNLTLQDANGTEIVIDTENEQPQIGDTATVDGQAANGEYTMPDGKVMVFSEGELTEIREPDDEMASKIRTIVQDELQKTMQETNENIDLAVQGLNKLTDKYDTLAKSVKSKYTPNPKDGKRNIDPNKDDVYSKYRPKNKEE